MDSKDSMFQNESSKRLSIAVNTQKEDEELNKLLLPEFDMTSEKEKLEVLEEFTFYDEDGTENSKTISIDMNAMDGG